MTLLYLDQWHRKAIGGDGVEIFLEIESQVLEHNVQLLFAVQNIQQPQHAHIQMQQISTY